MLERLILLAGLTLLTLPAQASQKVLHTEKSLYRNIIVYEENGTRCMRFGRANGSRQTCYVLRRPEELVFEYTRMMMSALYLQPAPKNILIVGLGGGTLPMTLRKLLPDARIDAVEIDPAVSKIAVRFFGLTPDAKLQVFEEDGRVFVKRQARAGRKYDLVMLDAFDHDYIPEHMLTREFLQEVKSLMAPGAVLASNTFSSSKLYKYESATYAAVFGEFYNIKNASRVVLTRLGGLPKRSEIERNARQFEDAFWRMKIDSDWLLERFQTQRDWPADTRVLTDQYSPSNLLNVS
ncbi:spermidine synthase [Chitinimonas sp. BJYL2]|uniref:spermidine synthase n=1 Tax=Chitinimonas sp. BJYL2 TaxID=2976696 RepID=UPI0022B30930|nr:fused MFS/spermidine synthase [Chitinimonas sp. BJYL2]